MYLSAEVRQFKYLHYALFSIVIFGAYFFNFRSFGLYEDDYWYVGMPINLDFNGLLDLMGNNFFNFKGGQGRLIGMTAPQFLAFLFFKIGGLPAVYILGSAIILLNSALIFNFVLKFSTRWVAALAAILFILYPADTTKPLLTHVYQLQLSLAFSLIALNLYISGHRIASYVLAFCSLLTYESAFLVFLSVPLFKAHWDRGTIKQWIAHLAICFSLLALIFLARKFSGESRIEEISSVKTLVKIIGSMVIGPLVSLYSFIQAIVDVCAGLGFLKWALSAGIVLFALWDSACGRRQFSSGGDSKIIYYWSIFEPTSDATINALVRPIFAAATMTLSSYLLAFTHFPPSALHGRFTSVHLASSVSGGILIALSVHLAFYCLRNRRHLTLALRAAVTVLLAILFSRGFLIQKDFSESWRTRTNFWRQVVELTPDAKEHTIIVADIDDMREDIKNIMTFYGWPIPEVYNQMVVFDSQWKFYPQVVIPGATFYGDFKCDEQGIYFEPLFPFLFQYRGKVYLEDGNTINLRYYQNKVTRLDAVFRCGTAAVHANAQYSGGSPPPLREVGKLILQPWPKTPGP